MASQAECESCFQADILISTFIFMCSGWGHTFNVAAWKFWFRFFFLEASTFS